MKLGEYNIIYLPVLLQECFVLFIFESIQFVEIFIFQAVLMCSVLGFNQGFLDERLRVLGFLGDDAMLAEDVVPAKFPGG